MRGGISKSFTRVGILSRVDKGGVVAVGKEDLPQTAEHGWDRRASSRRNGSYKCTLDSMPRVAWDATVAPPPARLRARTRADEAGKWQGGRRRPTCAVAQRGTRVSRCGSYLALPVRASRYDRIGGNARSVSSAVFVRRPNSTTSPLGRGITTPMCWVAGSGHLASVSLGVAIHGPRLATPPSPTST